VHGFRLGFFSFLQRWARRHPRKIFVDCGSNTCKVLAERIERGSETEFFAFEPQPELVSCAEEVRRGHPEVPIHFSNKAVWVLDGTMDFYLATEWGPNHRGGSTLLAGHVKNAAKVDYSRPIAVGCIDFSRWIRRNFSRRDHLVVKMDIEGAEYPVLEKMIADGTIDYINELIVEFHWQMNENMSQERHDALRTALDQRVLVTEWH
jgi:FkbM family methyltransferase